MSIVLGVRHHGPGSARAVRRALSAYQPEIVLVEGPPEADPLVPLAGSGQMRAPVALMAYPVGTAATAGAATRAAAAAAKRGGTRAAFWPFGEFSPEWQALRWAVAHEVPVRFIDLPTAVRLAVGDPAPSKGERADPLGALAAAAGYDDPERWWEDVVEHRHHPADTATADTLADALRPFTAIAEAMTEVRQVQEPRLPEAERIDGQRREAAMRAGLRAAEREYGRVAVVCGAWHVPALRLTTSAAADARVLRGLPRVRVAMTWVPWTHARLASGYGVGAGAGYAAGVRSPGWYHHLFTTPPAEVVPRWLVRAAGVLRRAGLPVSSAHVIEAARLAEALATMRGRPVPGLTEVTDAALAVLCDGDPLKLELIQRRLVIGDRIGAVPRDVPGVPLARDVVAAQRRLRLPPGAEPRELDLDLRREIDLERSLLLHRLGLLGVDWGVARCARAGKGTFWESWKLVWQPEFAVDLVQASAYGTTVRGAAQARINELADAAATLAEVTALLERCLLAELPEALPAVLRALDDRMARDRDVAHLMDALPALARTVRYGNVRRTERSPGPLMRTARDQATCAREQATSGDLPALRHVTASLITRICVGLPVAVTGGDDAAAAAMRDRIDAVHAAVGLLDEPELTACWREVLLSLSTREDLHGLLSGRINRLLLDAGVLDTDETGRRMALVLTVGVPATRAAAWIEGFFAGDGLLLAHDEQLLKLVDTWLTGIPPDAFVEALPLLRRTFSKYPAPQRRQIGERAVRLGTPNDRDWAGVDGVGGADGIDDERAELVLPTVAALLGWGQPPTRRAVV